MPCKEVITIIEQPKFQRLGYDSDILYPNTYDDAGHPENELVIYTYPFKPSLENIRDKTNGHSYFFELHSVLPFESVDGFDPEIDPLRVLRAENLEEKFFPNQEANVYLADSTDRGGTGSLKDPDAIVMLYRLKELGYDSFALASTGDCGASVCHFGSRLGINTHLFVPEDCYDRWQQLYQEMLDHRLVDKKYVSVHRDGKNMHDAFDRAVEYAHAKGIPHDYFFNNQLRIEGSKTMHIELFEQLGNAPDFYIQALGSGTGLFAMWKASYDLGLQPPQLIGVQPDGCSPMVRADHNKDLQENADTYVMGIGLPRIGPAFPYLKDVGSWFIAVHEGGMIHEKEGIVRDIGLLQESGIQNPGLEASLTVSGLEKIKDEIAKRAEAEGRTLDVVLGVSGRMRKMDYEQIYQK